jgi:two-component sensor histidine kinase
VLNILEDLETERKRLEQTQQAVVRSELAARCALREKEALLKEVHHRVKNNLQVISSLLNLQARSLSDPQVKAIFNTSQNRVQAIALVHEKLYQSANLSHIDFAAHVVTLVDGLFRAYGALERGIVCEYQLKGPLIGIELAIPCGLIVNELVSNCLSHAFPDRSHGLIRIGLCALPGERVELTIGDDGVGLPPALDPRKTQSLGLDLVFTFAEQIGAEVQVNSHLGTQFCFNFAEHGVSE